MNSVYYIFLVIIILSFITGIVITIIDNKNNAKEKINVAPVMGQQPVVENVAPVITYTNTQTPSVPVYTQESVVNNMVPYIPMEQNNVQPVVTPMVNPVQPVATPVMQSTPVQPVFNEQNAVTPGFVNPIENVAVNNNHTIQIDNTEEQEYFSVPVLIPLPMDDDRL